MPGSLQKGLSAAGLLLALAVCGCSRSTPVFAQTKTAAQSDANPYVNASVCANCHADKAKTYSHTGMARSFYKPTAESFPDSKPYLHDASGTWFQMLSKDGAYYQRTWQIGFNGKPQSVHDWKIDYIMGSGNHVRTYLHRTPRNTLIELPLARYAEKGGYWALNPGFDHPDATARREIGYECMFCHNKYPSIPQGHDEPGADAVYSFPLPEGIDCQRCHGPGGNHVRAAQAGSKAEELRRLIVNPARLPAERSVQVCLQCHLETTSVPLPNEIRRYDRGAYSYRPGEPLSAFIFFYDHAPGRGMDNKFEIVNSAYRLRKSQCYLKSNGALTCTTCHNPHDIPHGPAAADHYNATCRNCHAVIQASGHPTARNCIGCHMPQRRTEDVVHTVMTDHLIQRRPPPHPLAELPESNRAGYSGDVVPYQGYGLGADELYTAAAQVVSNTNTIAGLPRLEAAVARHKPANPVFYLELGDAYCSTNQFAKGVDAYRQAVSREPKSSIALRRLAYAYLGLEQRDQSLATLLRATGSNPRDAAAWFDLALVQTELSKDGDAIASLNKATELDPEYAEAEDRLGAVLLKTGQAAPAEEAFRSALRIQPTFAVAHANLADLLASRNALEEAVWHFERAGDKADQFQYAVTLARMNRVEEAEKHIAAALQANPNMAEAHHVMGGLLEKQGQLNAALAEYRETVRIRPDLGSAHFDMGRVLAKQHDLPAAAAEFRKAAADPYPVVREQALQALKAIGAR